METTGCKFYFKSLEVSHLHRGEKVGAGVHFLICIFFFFFLSERDTLRLGQKEFEVFILPQII